MIVDSLSLPSSTDSSSSISLTFPFTALSVWANLSTLRSRFVPVRFISYSNFTLVPHFVDPSLSARIHFLYSIDNYVFSWSLDRSSEITTFLSSHTSDWLANRFFDIFGVRLVGLSLDPHSSSECYGYSSLIVDGTPLRRLPLTVTSTMNSTFYCLDLILRLENIMSIPGRVLFVDVCPTSQLPLFFRIFRYYVAQGVQIVVNLIRTQDVAGSALMYEFAGQQTMDLMLNDLLRIIDVPMSLELITALLQQPVPQLPACRALLMRRYTMEGTNGFASQTTQGTA